MPKKVLRTSHSAIFGYWKNKAITKDGEVILENSHGGIESVAVIFDWGEPECWACRRTVKGFENYKNYETLLHSDISKIWNFAKVKSKLNKCHIIPEAAGGEDKPENLFLLCESCHYESPDTEDPKNFLKWVYKRRQKEKPVNGFILSELYQEFMEDCKEKNKDQKTLNPNIAKPYMHGGAFSQSTIAITLADTCENI